MNTDLEDRLRSFTVRTSELTSAEIAERVTRRRRRRRAVSASVSATVALSALAALIIVGGDDDRRSVVPAGDPTITADSTAAPSATTATSTTDSAISPTSSIPVENIALTGTEGGLYVNTADLPVGMTLTGASRTDATLGGGSGEFGVWSTTLAKYSADRSTVAEQIRVDTLQLPPDRTPVSLIGEDGATTITRRGVTVWINGSSASWAEGPWTIYVAGNAAPEDIVSVIENLQLADDGQVAVPAPPAGFETVGTLPNPEIGSGPQWTTGYVTEDATTYDLPVLTLTATTRPARPAEYLLVNDFSGHRTAAITFLGRRAILTTDRIGSRPSLTLTWDEIDGSQIELRYSPLRRDLTDDQLVAHGLSFGNGLRRADATTWAALSDQADATKQDLAGDINDPTWVRTLINARGLTMTGIRHIDYSEPALLIADVQEPDGTAGSCEIFLRHVTACTRDDDPLTDQTSAATAQAVDGGYIRLLVTADVRFVRLNDSVSGTGRNTDPLFPSEPQADSSPRVVYLRAPATGEIACVELRDETDTTSLAAFDLTANSLTLRPTSCNNR